MAGTREIQSRMKSIQDTMKITNAMYMISSTKLRKAKKELEETEPYFYTLQSMIARIMRHIPEMEHRYFERKPQIRLSSGEGGEAVSDTAKEQVIGAGTNGSAGNSVKGKTSPEQSGKKTAYHGYLVVTADKGLAGAYNHNVLKLAEEQLAVSGNGKLFVVGEVGRQYFAGKKIPVEEHFLYTAQNPTMSRARIIAAKLLELYDSGELGSVDMIYTSMKNGMQTETNLVRLLPLPRRDFHVPKLPMDVRREQFRFRPSPEAVIESVVPNYLAGYIYGGLVEAYCSEHNARMIAMEAANDSAGEMLRQLSVEYNRVRQGVITQEITEVISGAKAQKRKQKAAKYQVI